MSNWAWLNPETKQVEQLTNEEYYARGEQPFYEKKLKDELLRDRYRISTVFLGLNHGFGGRPQWFETMIFKPDTYEDVYCRRYETYAEAWNGHIDAAYRFNEGTLLEDEE